MKRVNEDEMRKTGNVPQSFFIFGKHFDMPTAFRSETPLGRGIFPALEGRENGAYSVMNYFIHLQYLFILIKTMCASPLTAYIDLS
jgi:hypothetical protein